MDWLVPLLLFVLVSTVTPGPNNLLLAASGLHFGVRKSMPHVLGIHLGVYGLIALCGLGLGQLLLAAPGAAIALRIFATAYLIYLAWQILGLKPSTSAEARRPMKIWEGIIFQASNPKAWMMAITSLNLALAMGGSMPQAVLIACLSFATLGVACNLVWVMMGVSLQSLLQDRKKRQWVNGRLAALTLLTIAGFWLY